MTTEIEKPIGYDFNDKRSDQADDASMWTPQDALYSASKTIKEIEAEGKFTCKGLLTVYLFEDKDGKSIPLYHTFSGSEYMMEGLLIRTLRKFIGDIR